MRSSAQTPTSARSGRRPVVRRSAIGSHLAPASVEDSSRAAAIAFHATRHSCARWRRRARHSYRLTGAVANATSALLLMPAKRQPEPYPRQPLSALDTGDASPDRGKWVQGSGRGDLMPSGRAWHLVSAAGFCFGSRTAPGEELQQIAQDGMTDTAPSLERVRRLPRGRRGTWRCSDSRQWRRSSSALDAVISRGKARR